MRNIILVVLLAATTTVAADCQSLDGSAVHVNQMAGNVEVSGIFQLFDPAAHRYRGSLTIRVAGSVIAGDVLADAWGPTKEHADVFNVDKAVSLIEIKQLPEPILSIATQHCGGSCSTEVRLYTYDERSNAYLRILESTLTGYAVSAASFNSTLESRRGPIGHIIAAAPAGCDTYFVLVSLDGDPTKVALHYPFDVGAGRCGMLGHKPAVGDAIQLALANDGHTYLARFPDFPASLRNIQGTVASPFGGPGDPMIGTPSRMAYDKRVSPQKLNFHKIADGEYIADFEFSDGPFSTKAKYNISVDRDKPGVIAVEQWTFYDDHRFSVKAMCSAMVYEFMNDFNDFDTAKVIRSSPLATYLRGRVWSFYYSDVDEGCRVLPKGT